MIKVDARGLSRPQPVLLAKKAIAENANKTYQLIYSND